MRISRAQGTILASARQSNSPGVPPWQPSCTSIAGMAQVDGICRIKCKCLLVHILAATGHVFFYFYFCRNHWQLEPVNENKNKKGAYGSVPGPTNARPMANRSNIAAN